LLSRDGSSPHLKRHGGSNTSRRPSVQSDTLNPALLDEHGIIEYATLELRVHPPSVKIDNTLDDKSTVVIVDSANRPGTLVEVVERLTELGLGVKNAQISSDGGWFVDVFHVTNVEGEKVTDKRTLERIENILDLNFDISPGVPSYESHVAEEGEGVEEGSPKRVTTVCPIQGMNVIEMMLEDEPGLLSRVSKQITAEQNNKEQLNIYDMLLWTHKGYAAMLFTVSVLESGQPICLEKDLHDLQVRLEEAIGIRTKTTTAGEANGNHHHHHLNGNNRNGIHLQDSQERERRKKTLFINVDCCYDTLYVEKRFYRLKMRTFSLIHDQEKMMNTLVKVNQQQESLSLEEEHHNHNHGHNHRSFGKVSSRYDPQTRYTTFHVSTRDRPQLLFDTVCTLSDLGIDVFHATIDTDEQMANLEFFVKSSSGAEIREEEEMNFIKMRLGMALAFSAPTEALCLYIKGQDNKGMLHRISKEFVSAGLDITYCTSRTDPIEMQTCCVFYVLRANDERAPVTKFDAKLERCLKSIGAKVLPQSAAAQAAGLTTEEGGNQPCSSSSSKSKFSKSSHKKDHQDMTVLEKSWNKLWRGV
jgi:hypothetical protein